MRSASSASSASPDTSSQVACLATLVRARLERLLRAAGIDPCQSWQAILLCLLFRDGALTRPETWRGLFSNCFPHVDFRRPRAADMIRIPLQLAWLLIVRIKPLPASRPWKSRIEPALDMLLKMVASAMPNALREAAARLSKRVNHASSDVNAMEAKAEEFARHGIWDHPTVRYVAYACAATLALLCVTTPFSTLAQLIFVTLLWIIAMLIRRIPGPVATLLLIVLSVTASTRYLWWRVAYTLNWDETFDFFWGVLLLFAEIYTWIILVLGYVQTSWPLRRGPTPLPDDDRVWPTVDVFIPTYNEPLKVVMPTVYAALGIDWPRDKINIYLLDDGRRDEFRRFAAEAGIGYIIRPDNFHAKAGNLNHAMTKTSGEYIAIFDCDHIPTRSFLQATMGWFVRDPKLALLQTPHHFFSPDPFERNLGLFRSMPNEGELFYGVIQDGNDLWNATFFCGSCAVIKRGPLEQVGGIAVETVTEDAHTALKLQRLGYRSAYINLPQAAGLATESLSAHIGQRIRWARGMAQIFRLDNPFLGKGLNWAQRICYGNAMLHFLNGGPRLIFLTAPLAFLLFHAYVIYTPAISVILYVLPHMVHANITNSRIQGSHRHSFWAEVYETVLAWYIVRPTTVALLDPHKGKFNVTAKGGLVEKNYFDWTISLPYLIIVGLNLLGFVVGIGRIIWGPADEIPTTLLNLFWTGYNVLLLGAAISVASETKQVRRSHRVNMRLPAVLHLPGGQLMRCETEDFSEGGAALQMEQVPELPAEELVMVSLWRGDEEFTFPARVVGQSTTRLRLRWELSTTEQQMTLVQCTFARADAWVSWAEGRHRDKPLLGLRKVLTTGVEGYRRVAEHALPSSMPLARKAASAMHWIASLLPRPPQPVKNNNHL
ncbi:UDP-forming cellulose synthase catalytic subunit [Noviherbaspirillum sp. CPCC 100848]|uniref:Cellulose synthase catalytic subunit [UDP-forming] n=1 Tax=Noviherbaspirillum album TaxID=3080276 RepID=A0ABU6J8X6_9BURK|nr:UDP-forming cellulose synthase catalytic subunit [Noviherbaspirillum sp. CPCC 100848]MEC4719800.1 UDP-forming cellulose synthase catalytic subunit [Noviherbaspirillum sp. CPCC 100848]